MELFQLPQTRHEVRAETLPIASFVNLSHRSCSVRLAHADMTTAIGAAQAGEERNKLVHLWNRFWPSFIGRSYTNPLSAFARDTKDEHSRVHFSSIGVGAFAFAAVAAGRAALGRARVFAWRSRERDGALAGWRDRRSVP